MKTERLMAFKKIGFQYKIAFLYFTIGFLWIFLSDTISNSLIADKELLTIIMMTKGFSYVIITSLLLFFLINNHLKILQIAKEKAEESDRLKSAFLANMSHEIRTPMNGILGFAELLKEPKLKGEEQLEYIRIIEKSGNRLLNIINDIVDISKIEAGQVEVYIEESNINDQVEFIYNFFQPEFERKGLQSSFKNALPSSESIVKTDREKIYAILTNLVKNAIKYTNHGSVELGYNLVTTRTGAETAGHASLQFYVKDTGIGIPKERQKAIFERFIQADISDKMALQGAGLGLSISKAYVEMLGGKIWVESEPGKGTIFYFTIAYNSEKKSESIISEVVLKDITNRAISKLKVLIAEDDKTSDLLITIALKNFSHEVLHAENGPEAIRECRRNPDIDLVLMDIKMPELNGYDATRQIRQFNKDVIIIAQSAYGLLGDREKAIEAGCNDYITKPILIDELLALIQKHLNNKLKSTI